MRGWQVVCGRITGWTCLRGSLGTCSHSWVSRVVLAEIAFLLMHHAWFDQGTKTST